MDEDDRQKKLEAGRAKKPPNMQRSDSLASFRQKRAKSDSARAAKKTPKRKGQAVAQNDSAAQDRHLESALSSANDTQLHSNTNHEKPQHLNESVVRPKPQKDQPPTAEQSPSPVNELRDEELLSLTGQEHLKQLQEAVEKRNQIIARLSSNLQEALASRDQVQLEAQMLAGEIQALQRQLQQASVDFLRIKSQSGADVLGSRQQLPLSNGSQREDLNHKDVSWGEFGSVASVSQPKAEGVGTFCDTDTVLHQLREKLEVESENSKRVCADLAKERENHQHVLSLLEEEKRGREEEREKSKERLQSLQTELDQAHAQCLEMQQYKEEKEMLNREVLELRERLQEEEDAGRRFGEEAEKEMNLLKEEMETVRQLLEERVKELHSKEEEVMGLKASKNLQNQAKAGFSRSEMSNINEANVESGPHLDLLMDRYLSSAAPACFQSPAATGSFEQSSQLDVSHSFELNSEVLGDQPFLSISNRSYEEQADLSNSISEQLEISVVSEQHYEETDLEKQLLNQQCVELRQELASKEIDLIVLRAEVIKSAEELEEARSRWAQVTKELRGALIELHQEKKKNRLGEVSTLSAREQANLKNKLGALWDEKENCLMGTEDDTSLWVPAAFTSAEEHTLGEELQERTGEKQQELLLSPEQEKQTADTSKLSRNLKDANQLQTLQAQCDSLMSELEDAKVKHKSASALLGQKSVDMDAALNDLEATRAQVLQVQTEKRRLEEELEKSQSSLDSAEKQKSELQSQVLHLRHDLTRLEEALDEAAQEREEHKRKDEEMSEQIKKMEDVLEEELEQFEKRLKDKDAEVAQEREKWEEERQEKVKELLDVTLILDGLRREREEEVKALLEKQVRAVEEETATLRRSHRREIEDLKVEHRQEISDLRTRLQKELLVKQTSLEDEQKRQISLIKQVTEREHQRMMAELIAQHGEELSQLRTKVSLEIKETMEAAHQAEMQQAQVQKALELEALRLSLTKIHATPLELMQAQHESELDQIRQLNEQQQEQLRELHQRDIDELKQQWESRVARERFSVEEKRRKETQALRSEYEKEASSEEQKQSLEKELKEALASRDSAASALEDLVLIHQALLQENEQKALHLQEKDQQLQQEVLRLQEEKELLKKSSEQEVGQLWSQLESMRASRQDLGELKEQLLARSSRVEDIERLKAEFNEQKREIKAQNEAELESLRRYFEQRLQASEESYREEIALLQLRLVESALEESVIKTANSSFTSGGQAEEETHNVPLDKSEQHKGDLQLKEMHAMELSSLRSSLSLSFKEELEQARSDLTDHYFRDLQEMKTRHALELEQLRAKLSDRHIQELIRIRMEAARQVEVEVELRMWCHSEELQTQMTIIHTQENRLAELSRQHNAERQKYTQKLKEDFALELVHFEEALKQEREHVQEEKQMRLELQAAHEAELAALRSERERTLLENALKEQKIKTLQAAHGNNESLQVLEVRQELEAKYSSELQREKSHMAKEIKDITVLLLKQGEEQLQRAQESFQEEKTLMEQCFAQKTDISLAELKNKHQAELEQERATLLNKHSQEMNTLDAKHKAQLESLSASHSDQLVAMKAELEDKHKSEIVALEASLNCKRKKDLERLEAVFEDASKAQLEAQEAALVLKHQEEKDELEKRMLGNMDTLEATYLKEIQTVREEMVKLEERHVQDLNSEKTEHQRILERRTAEQLSSKQKLRQELAQLHVEKFQAMAAELSHVHKEEMSAQKESLDAEHCKALELLKQQVLELEKQHNIALQELSHSYTADKEQLVQQHQLQLQEVKGISARELEACRRELEEEASRQRQHFLEEVELLKVQSEETLQDRINQLKTDCEKQKGVELEDLRRSFTSEQEEKERHYTGKMSQLTAQLQQLDAVVTQLRAEVGCLQGELAGKRAEMETLDTLLQRRERETQEGSNLLKMLTDDLHTAKEERCKLHKANNMLKKLLSDMFRSTIATEELIGQKICARQNKFELTAPLRSSTGKKDAQESGISVADMTSEDLELTQLPCESLLVSDGQLNREGEEAALNACRSLRHTVDTLLELLNQANTQLEQTHTVHMSLEERFSHGREDSTQLVEQHKLLLQQIDQEAKQKSQLQLQLHKAEGLLEGYVAEKAVLEENLLQKEAQEEKLVEELEDLRGKLHQMHSVTAELEALRGKHQELSEEHTILLRQKEHLTAGLGDREKALLAEADRLTQDRLDVQRQAEKDRSSLSQRLRALERELEEQETRGLETELHHKTHTDDLNQRVQALEKQLKHNRQFIQEQAIEREHERDEFQQEIRQLEAQLRQSANVDVKGRRFDDLVLQVESLQAIIKDKMEDQASLVTANQQAQRDLAERNEEIDKLAGRIRELEHALLNSDECNRSVGQLEQELHRAKLREQELKQDKQALEQQQLSSRLQISALQSKLDETKHCYNDNIHDPTQELRDALDTAQQSLQSKEHEVEILLGQLENVQSDFSIKEAELKHLTLQLELLSDQKAASVGELQEQIAVLNENVSALTILTEEKEAKQQEEDPVEDNLPSALLEEKNQEIDHLHSEIHRLSEELENTRNDKDLEAEIDDLSSQVEHLKSEIIRVRQDRQEEEERLHEVISTLQAELATLGPNLHEVSDSQDGDSINPSPAPSPEPPLNITQERRGEPNSLKQELSLTHSASSRSLQSRLKALQSQLETALAEKDGLERLLHTQEEEHRRHGKEFGRRLIAEREKADDLQGLLAITEAELVDVKAQMEEERRRRQVSEEERDRCKVLAREAGTWQEEKSRLSLLLLEFQQKEQERATKEHEMNTEMDVLRESCVTLEEQVQKLRAEVVDMEEVVAQERAKVEALETVKVELSAERKVLRRREGQLQEEIEKLRQEVTSLKAQIDNLMLQLKEKEEEARKEVLTHAEVTLARADEALRQRETELAILGAEHQALRAELTAVKRGLRSSTERAEKLHEEGQTKDRALAELETDNQHLKGELSRLQEDLTAQEEELAYRQTELQQLRQQCHLQDPQRDFSHKTFEDAVTVFRGEISLSSPEVLRRLECSEDRHLERFHASVLDSRVSELTVMNSTGVDLPQVIHSPAAVIDHSRTITPDPATQSSHSLRSVSENFSMLDPGDGDKAHELERLNLTTPSSPLGSTSSLSAPEWASDGYGSNVSSELGARLRVELAQTERLDSQFVAYLRCRGMNPTTNTDSAAGSMSYSEDLLSPELQGLLKKVNQESCRILNFSQRRPTSSSQPHAPDFKVLTQSSQTQYDSEQSTVLLNPRAKASSKPPMSWQQEKRALQETVIALRELLCRMADRRTRTNSEGDREQVQTDGQTESQIRDELEENLRQLQCAYETQQEQKSKIQSLRMSVEEGEEALRVEQTRVQELLQQLKQERAFSVLKDRELEERREAAHVSSEQQRSEVLALKGQMEQERVACSNLRRELQIEQSRSGLLENRLVDTQKRLEEERHQSAHQHDLSLQEKLRLEHLLTEAESHLSKIHSKLAEAHRKLDEERDRCSRQLDEMSRGHEADTARDRKFISDMHAQLEQERRQGEELAATTEKLRAELLQSKKKWEEDKSQGEMQREQAANCHRIAVETLREQKEEASCALEVEHERSRQREVEVSELKEKLRLQKDKEREREEQWERERRKGWQEQMERDKRLERTNEKLREMELLRQQDQQRVQDLQHTLSELERQERDMTAQRLSGRGTGHQHEAAAAQQPSSSSQTGSSQSPQQVQIPSNSPSGLLEKLMKENSELMERVTSLSQERAALKHKHTFLERQLRHAEKALATVPAESENIPINDMTSHSKVQRLYERYLRAESFRKALVYQKRYLLLLLGGFQECEQATLCLIARMGARPSPPPACQRRPLGRFRTVVRVVIAVSRMRFLTRKWQKAIRRLSLSGTVNGHVAGPKAEVLRQQQLQPRSSLDSPPNRDTVSALVPPSKSPFRLHNRPYASSTLASGHSGGASQDPEKSLTEYIHHLEKVQQQLVGSRQDSSTLQPDTRKSGH